MYTEVDYPNVVLYDVECNAGNTFGPIPNINCTNAFPCIEGLLPQPPEDGGFATLIQTGFEFGPCLGTSSEVHEEIPGCPEVSVLVMDDTRNASGWATTIFQLRTEYAQDLVIDLVFSKEVDIQEIEVLFFFVNSRMTENMSTVRTYVRTCFPDGSRYQRGPRGVLPQDSGHTHRSGRCPTSQSGRQPRFIH